MRSGFVAGDAALLKKFLLYRTYHGSAMSPSVQAASHRGLERRGARAWRTAQIYRANSPGHAAAAARCSTCALPDAGFYLWAGVDQPAPSRDTEFARAPVR